MAKTLIIYPVCQFSCSQSKLKVEALKIKVQIGKQWSQKIIMKVILMKTLGRGKIK